MNAEGVRVLPRRRLKSYYPRRFTVVDGQRLASEPPAGATQFDIGARRNGPVTSPAGRGLLTSPSRGPLCMGPIRSSRRRYVRQKNPGCPMKNQYFGDVNDYKKYSLLRLLGNEGRLATTVCWALTPDDGRTDGSKVGYLGRPEEWRSFDPVVFDHLRTSVVESGDRRVAVIEKQGVLSNCWFFSDLLPADSENRDVFFARLRDFARGTDLVFLDPDNGLGVASAPRGSRNSSKYVYPDEISQTFGQGHSILVYQHFPRTPRGPYLASWVEQFVGLSKLRKVVSFSTSHVAFLLLPQPRHEGSLLRSSALVSERWGSHFKVQIHFPSLRAGAIDGCLRRVMAPAS